jgi:CRP-like cAMP-binding protein
MTPSGVLAGLTAQDLDHLITLGTILHCAAGEVVFRENSLGREWYIVLEGSVRVDVDPDALGVLAPGASDPRAILTLGAGSGFGELALIDAELRSATVVALTDDTRLLVITPQAFEALMNAGHSVAPIILRNIVRDLAAKLRRTRLLLVQQLVIGHHIRALREELDADSALVDPLIPLHKTLVIRDPDAFVLGDLAANRDALPSKEILDVLVFAEPRDLHPLLNHAEPSGEAILHGLFTLIRHGRLPTHTAHEQLSYRYVPERGRRAGTLLVAAAAGEGPLRIDWEVKGWDLDPASNVARASLCLSVASDPSTAPGAHAEELIAGTTMPIQAAITAQLEAAGVSGAGYRVLAVHHRTHEVAHTLQMLRRLGFTIDAFVGIPYGEASWATNLMLDRAAGHRYHCLRSIQHPSGPPRYLFDATHSSFLADEIERDLTRLYDDPANAGSYFGAMNALLTYLLEQAIRTCRERGERLLIYEDGAYITPLIYAIYHQPAHPLHAMLRAAVDNRLVVGSIEVTTSGERKQVAVIREHGGQALLPVVSGARDDVKLIFEAVGVAEAVIQASATALGNIGLPTFGFRRIAVLGGNGAIGVRLIERLAETLRDTRNLFVVDPTPAPFARPLPLDDTPQIASRLRYLPMPRYPVAEGCALLTPAGGAHASAEGLAAQIVAALAADGCDQLAIREAAGLPAPVLAAAWEIVAQRSGFSMAEERPLDGGLGRRALLRRDAEERPVSLLAPGVVLAFASLQPLLRAGVDTVIGVTGTPAFNEADLDAFLDRPVAPGACDDLALISGSSKDYEFQRILGRLNGGGDLHGFRARKAIHPDVGAVYHLTRDGAQKRLVLLADGFVVNFFARYEKGVKTEYMDPIMTMQLLGLARLAGGGPDLEAGLHQAKDVLRPEHLRAFWRTLDASCGPPEFAA